MALSRNSWSVCQACPTIHCMVLDWSLIEMNLCMNIRERKRWVTDFMASTADPSQMCQAHFAGRMYNMIKSCNSVQIPGMSTNKLHRQVKAYPIPLYLWSETWPSIQRNSRLLFCAGNVAVSQSGLISLFLVFWIRGYLWSHDHGCCSIEVRIASSLLCCSPLAVALQPRSASLPLKGPCLRCAVLLTWIQV